ncbi:MAG TPA: hypothetical protein VHN19_08415 [Burkholderiales bacterium]|jgi:hypothetical protein|nr:hypothetical protein [Burkholderiales bacterium]
MPVCQIVRIRQEHADRWKWRYRASDGAVTESPQTFAFHYECVAAARLSGYQPDLKWVAGD